MSGLAGFVRLAKVLLGLGAYGLLYAPLVVLMAFSFNDSKLTTLWKGFTWKWYAALFENQALLDAAWNSLCVAGAAATLASGMGALAAVALHRWRFRGREAMRGGMYLLMMYPDLVLGISLLLLFAALGLSPGFPTLLLAHVTFCLPFVTVTVLSRLAGFDARLTEAAQDLGAGEWQAFRRVTLPLILPAVAAGWLLSFTLSLDDVIVSFFTTGPDYEVLPQRIYSMVRLGVKPEVNALSAVLILFTMAAVAASHFLTRFRRSS